MQNYKFPVAFLDSPQILDAAVTPIPGSASSPLQVISDLGSNNATEVTFIDTTGDYIGVFIGGIGVETLRCIIGGGLNSSAKAYFPAHSRISLRSMTTTAVSTGKLVLVFMSY